MKQNVDNPKSWAWVCHTDFPYLIYDENLKYLLPYLWPGQLNTLFMIIAAREAYLP